MWAASVEYARSLAPIQHQGTMQALVRGLYYLIGCGIGSVFAGYVIADRGYVFMYRLGGTLMLVWSVIWNILMVAFTPKTPNARVVDHAALQESLLEKEANEVREESHRLI
uniref:Major facilitator superfamily associated domain-containing protein n=1 Tax=Octactis speculum TaxID=3111310 RepID=A0A7S2HCR4_9STRA|mmetsp:Transcript_63642/g.87482  ORF Transcript_63642/g.87482 Transcript_63642/m.87482 type:complete len:111 (+) Transcript_63642:238-570(+)